LSPLSRSAWPVGADGIMLDAPALPFHASAETSKWELRVEKAAKKYAETGNAIDRIAYGAVADFFYFHAWGRGWYVFNIADIAITFGVVLLLADMVVGPKASEPNLSGSRSSGRKNE